MGRKFKGTVEEEGHEGSFPVFLISFFIFPKTEFAL